MKNFTEFSAELDEASNDYFKRRKDEEGRIAGTKAPAKRTPKQTDYEKKRKEQKVTESAVCAQCDSDPCICDDSHGFVSEAIDKEHPIVKEYDSLKKNHDIKSLRGLIKGQHRIVDTSEYKTKDHAISAYLRTKHGDKKVDKAFGFKEEVELDEAHKIGSPVEVIKGSGKGIKGHIGEIRHGAYKGAPKTYTVFHGDKGAIQVGKEHIRAVKEEVELDEAGQVGDSLGYLTAAERTKELARRKAKIAGNTTPASKKFIDKALNKEEAELDEAAQGHTIEAHGIRGMKRTAWRKTFKSHEHLSKWADANDSVEVHATRDLEQAKKGNLSPAIKEESQAMHRVGVTVSEKDHPMVSKRLEKQQKFVKVSAGSKEEAVTKAKKFYTKQGYHVHGAAHHSMVSEEIKSTSIPSFKEFIE